MLIPSKNCAPQRRPRGDINAYARSGIGMSSCHRCTWSRLSGSVVCLMMAVCLAVVGSASGSAAWAADSSGVRVRVFFQDDEAGVIKWADVLSGDPPRLGTVREVAGFPKLDPEHQRMVQMQAARGMLLVGIRDDDDGTFQSGWVLIESGVVEEEHGDHSHWEYADAPRVRASALDDKQGNPAHMYVYDDVFYLANDKLNGYTRVDPSAIGPRDDERRIRSMAGFHQGGGSHITLAVTDDQIGYATWSGRKGEDSGRVDVTAIKPEGNASIARSFNLPHAGLHGATVNQGKVFFAPSDGICWVEAKQEHSSGSADVQVHHLSLGTIDKAPRRTGSFVNFGQYVAFTSGRGADAEFHVIDASADQPEVVTTPLKMAEDNRPAGLSIVRPRRGSPLAFIFHDHAADIDAPNLLSLIELDPDGDKRFADLQFAQTLRVGNARVEGHRGITTSHSTLIAVGR